MQRQQKRMAYIRNQKRHLKYVVEKAFEGIDDPKKDYWTSRISAHLSRRLQNCYKEKWVTLLSEFTDSAAYGSIQQKKMKEYLLMARDAAAAEVRRNKRGE